MPCQKEIFKKHKCKKEDIQSARLIQKDSKPCPKCGIFIHKIDGCDQMWCVQSKTAFSWETGLVLNGRIHNPHFYEWQRQQNNGVAPRVPGDDPVMGCRDYVLITDLQRSYQYRETPDTSYIEAFHRFVGHIQDEIRAPEVVNNLKLRIDYLLKEISEEEFIKTIQQLDKRFQKKQDLRNVVEVLLIESDNIFTAIIEYSNQSPIYKNLKPFVDRIKKLIDFANQQFQEIGKKYANKAKSIVYVTNNIRRSRAYFDFI